MKRIGKRICSIMLCAVMLTGLFNADASALAPAADGGRLEDHTTLEQIGSHYEADELTGALAPSPELEGDTAKSYADGWVKTDKLIRAGENENEFSVTLDIRTKEEITDVELSEDAAAVIVLDLSGSMNSGGKLESAKRAALEFIRDFARTEGQDTVRKIAVVGFSGQPSRSSFLGRYGGINGAVTYQDWTDAAGGLDISKINNMKAEGGTCLQAGLVLARNLLNDKEISGISNRNIVLLTDGNPTYHISDNAADSTSTESVGAPNEISGSGSATSHQTHTKTESTAKAISGSGINVYGVYLGNDRVECTDRSCKIKKTGADWLRDDCGFSVYAAGEVSDLSDIFMSISESIRIQSMAWIAEDPMGEMFDFAGFEAVPGSEDEYSYDYAENKIHWNLRLSAPAFETEDGFDVYRLTYRVRLNTLAPGYRANEYYPVNGVTSVTYSMEKSSQSGSHQRENGIAYFNVPSVKGYDADVSFRKTDGDGNGLGGAVFELYCGDGLRESAVSDEEGTVLFKAVPSGHTYTVTEKAAPEGFVADGEKYGIGVSFGAVVGAVGKDNTVVNLPEAAYGALTVTKTVSGPGAAAEDEFTFNVELDDSSVSGSYGGMTFADGKASFNLKAGESVTADGLPDGTGYTVTEEEKEGYSPSVNGESGSVATGVIQADVVSTAAFDNFYHGGRMTPEPYVTFDITKNVEVAGDVIPAGRNTFRFVVSASIDEADALLPEPVIEIYGPGSGTETVAVEREDIPQTLYVWEKAGDDPDSWTYDRSVYRVTLGENDAGGMEVLTYEKIAEADTAKEPEAQSWTAVDGISFTNVFCVEDIPYIERQKGALHISKTVINGDRDREFAFTVTVTDPYGEEIEGRYGDMLFTAGVAHILLKHGESAVASGLPADAEYAAWESDVDGYSVSVNGEEGSRTSGVILANETVEIRFQNDKEADPDPIAPPDDPPEPPTTLPEEEPKQPTVSPSEGQPKQPTVPTSEGTPKLPPALPQQVRTEPTTALTTASVATADPVSAVPRTDDPMNVKSWLALMCPAILGMSAAALAGRRRRGRRE